MGLLTNLGEAISANVNEAIENNTRPDIMARYYADKAQKELDESRNHAASVMVNRKTLEKRDIPEIEAEIVQLESYAEMAMKAGNKEDARRFIENKVAAEKRLSEKRKALEDAKTCERNTLEAYDAQRREVEAMDADMNEIMANVATAASKTTAGPYATERANRATTKFRNMLARSRRMVDEADANKEIAERNTPASLASLKAKYNHPVDAVAEQMAVLEAKYS